MDRARELLNEMRPCLLELYRHGDASTSPFSLPLPLDQDINPELLNLLTATLVHQLYVNQQHPDYVASLFIPGSFSSWLPNSLLRTQQFGEATVPSQNTPHLPRKLPR